MHVVTKAYFCDLLIPQTSVQAWGTVWGQVLAESLSAKHSVSF